MHFSNFCQNSSFRNGNRINFTLSVGEIVGLDTNSVRADVAMALVKGMNDERSELNFTKDTLQFDDGKHAQLVITSFGHLHRLII